MKKLAVVFPLLNQHELAKTAIDFASAFMTPGEQSPHTREVLVLDNQSEPAFECPGARTVRLERNIGVYPAFWEALKHTDADVLAFFHTDLMICEKGWDARVMAEFDARPNLGLIGFIGSNEIDGSGGRGLGTTSNFQGATHRHGSPDGSVREWTGSPAHVHGKVDAGYSPAAVVDGCAMIFRREVLEKVKQRENFPPHHFYDRLLSCETREAGYEMGVLGIGCDHISGQTVAQEPAYELMAQAWCEAHGFSKEHNWDSALYHVAESRWLYEYRDAKHLVPCRV